jgi:hypothetical protein
MPAQDNTREPFQPQPDVVADQPSADAGAPVEPSAEVHEAGREDMAIRGAAAVGALHGNAGYAGGAATGTGGAVGMRQIEADEDAERRQEEGYEEGETPGNFAQQDQ